MTKDELKEYFVSLNYTDILIMKAPDQEEFAPFMCHDCHDKEHHHLPMVLVDTSGAEQLTCLLCMKQTSLAGVVENSKPFGIQCYRERFYRDNRPEETLQI